MKLHQIKHDYRAKLWCGIAALATVTGRPTSECRAAIVDSYGKNFHGMARVTGISNSELRHAFRLFGYDMQLTHWFAGEKMRDRQTLAHVLRTRTPEQRAGILVVNITGHYVTVKGRTFVDNAKKDGVSIKDAPHRRSRVYAAWLINKSDAVSTWTPPAKQKRLPNNDRAKAVRLAQEHGITIDVSDWRRDGHIWVTCEKLEATGEDIYEGDHIALDWREALDRVQAYAEVLQS